MFTTADLPTALRLDPTAPHVCGLASCPDSADHARSDASQTGVPSHG